MCRAAYNMTLIYETQVLATFYKFVDHKPL